MTSIDKLQIRGIRSFSPVDHQTLQFQKPLTLCACPHPAHPLRLAHPLTACETGRIVGKNGSGKTVRGPHEPAHRHALHRRTLTQAYSPPTQRRGPQALHLSARAQTIIECLKMGCTGELPPNCKNGQAFIHDPKILAKQEIKAQIKLKFFGLTAHPVVCTRSFSLTQKATKMEYKAFEAALQTVDSSGARQTLSYKCAVRPEPG